MYYECTVTADCEHPRRLLFLSYWMPPRNGIGSVRAAHLIKHLPRYGWSVTAMTAPLPHSHVESRAHQYIQTGYCDLKGLVKRAVGIGNRSTHEALGVNVPAYGSEHTLLQRLIRGLEAPLRYPDEHIGWLPFASVSLWRTLKEQRFDAVMSSAPPFTAHLAAALSHGRVPWIADLRDLWAENDSVDRSATRTLLDDRLERFCLSRTAALIASSALSAERFQRRYPGKQCFSISTGFDSEEWERIEFGTEPQCTLLYAGTLYWGKRDPTTLFAALRAVLDDRLAEESEIRADFYVSSEPWLIELISKFGLQNVVRIRGFIEREAVLRAERRADRLIVLSWDGPTAEGVVAGKLFEYFGSRRPILAIGGPAVSGVEDLLRETGAGVRVRSVEEAKAEIAKAIAEHRSGRQRIVSSEGVRAYTGDACAERFAGILDYAVAETLRRGRRESSAATATPANTAK
jgi:glycosyltransferase involved in cell wall biosynthesis